MYNPLLKVINLMVSTVLIINLIPNIMVFAEDEKEKEIIRVGYTENYGVVKTPTVEGLEGYGYEYLQKIEEYLDYEFEFILCDWSQTTDMLRSGELDIVAPTNITAERLDEFYFTENVYAKGNIVLLSNTKVHLDESSYNYLNGANIGVRKNGMFNIYLEELIKEYNLTPNIEYVDISNFTEELNKGYFDYLLTSTVQMEPNLNVVLSLGTSLGYFMGTSKELIDELDYAMSQIEVDEYLYKEDLHEKYFSRNIVENKYISEEELSLMQNTTYNVGVINMYPTFGYENERKIDNVSVDVLNFLADILKIDINIKEISAKSTKEELDKLDFYIYLNGYETDLYENESIPYMEDNLLLIENKNLENTTIGVLDYYNLDIDMIKKLSQMDSVIYYSSVRELIDSLNAGNITSMMVANSVYELLFVLLNPIEHTVTDLSYPIYPTIIYTDNFPIEKIEIIDKAISYLTKDNINTMLLHNISLMSELERRHMYQRYIYTILPILIIGYIIFKVLKTNKQKEIDKAANYDELTSLYTQAKFIKETRKLLNKNPNIEFSMLTFDIDNFKYINELYGFQLGDNILNVIGKFLKDNVPENYPIARLSSDHFILVTKTNDQIKDGKLNTERSEMISKRISAIAGVDVNVEFSLGLYMIEDNKLDVSKMIDYCNLARSYSKNETGSIITIYSDLMKEKETIKNDIIFRMNNALKDNEFVLYYQPKFDIITKKIVGAEALVRWFANGKMMPPNDFIPLFEKNGFIEKLDYYVIDTACEFIAKHNEIKIPVISVNLSSVTIMKHDVIEKIINIVKKHSLKPEQIELEITESAFIDQFETALQRIDDLRLKGFTISMDDFGTGVSSLGRLKNMEIDVLKIDREFIIETLENHKSDVILENIIKMASQLELETIAEGIETEEQLGFLRETGCDVGQGYYFARPLPEPDFLKLLNDEKN